MRFTDRKEEGVPDVEARLAAMEGRPVTGVAGVRGLPNIVIKVFFLSVISLNDYHFSP